MNPKPKIVLVDAVLTFRITQLGKRAFPDLAKHAGPVLRILGFDDRTHNAVVVPDTDDPDGTYVLSYDLVKR